MNTSLQPTVRLGTVSLTRLVTVAPRLAAQRFRFRSPPVADLSAGDDSASTYVDTPVTASVAGNDSTTSGGSLTFAKTSNPANGTVTVATNGSYTYTPDAGFLGSDSFTYTVTDPTSGESLVRTATITVNLPTFNLSATNDTATTNEDTSVSGSVATKRLDHFWRRPTIPYRQRGNARSCHCRLKWHLQLHT